MDMFTLNRMLVMDIMDGSPPDQVIDRLAQALTSRDQQIAELRKRNIDLGWAANPDRMGGQFTQEEINQSLRGGDGW